MKGGENQADQMSRRRLNPLPLLIVLTAAVVAVAVLVTVLKRDKNPEAPPSRGETESKAEADDGLLHTPVGVLTVPEGLADACRIADTSRGGQYAVSFYGRVGTEEVFLFELAVGGTGTGYNLGSLPDESGALLPVWLNISGIDKRDGWTEDDYAEINNLQTYVNDLIEQVNELIKAHGEAS